MEISHITKIVNVELSQLNSTRTVDFLIKQVTPDFKDAVNTEHVYSIEAVKDEFIGENDPAFGFKLDIEELIKLCNYYDAGYFKILNS